MNGFEVVEVASSAVVVTVAFESASWKSATLEVTILAKNRMTKKIDVVYGLCPNPLGITRCVQRGKIALFPFKKVLY